MMRQHLISIIDTIPVPPAQPLPGESVQRAEHLAREAWYTCHELDELMTRLEVLSDIAEASGHYGSPAWMLWLRCRRISEHCSRRWKRRQAAAILARKQQ